ncbi:response regulator [Mesoterricola sediminis]|uniref:Response regulatory domain-containing protein n=1 Tax=Mesoterricola sediminis TaxID=2927980 RepID=A0AA48KBS5_9BACT|nr:response regulator [Mesoterricola sediminis]BDU76176.1 hypothetical protein METESE_11340 [Mesoterricola sediminis]
MIPSAGSPALKTALIVEDEQSTLRFYMTGLKGLHEFRLLSAVNGQEALDVLRDTPVDVVVTDLNMPVMDGYSLIAVLAERYPSLPIIVITSVAEPGMREQALQLGALRVIPKPPRLSAVMETLRSAVSVPPQGLVRGIGLGSVLQLLNWERRSATLTVRSEEGTGHLYVKEGELVHALFGREEGLPAAYRILGWEHVQAEFVFTCKMQPTIDLPLPELLMNLAFVRDTQRMGQPGAGEAHDERWHG